jgi:hypothetical protein
MIRMLRSAVVVIFMLSLSACASIPVKEIGKTTIKSGEFHEECVSVHRGQRIVYAFDTSAPVDFNIHYHSDRQIFYPVKKDNVRADSGKYEPTTDDIHCLMWTNKDLGPVSLNYEYSVRDEVKPIAPPPSTRPGNVY